MSEQNPLLKQARRERHTVLVHPSQLGAVQKDICKQLKRKTGRWDDELKGIVTKISKVEILNGGRAKVMDDSPYLQY